MLFQLTGDYAGPPVDLARRRRRRVCRHRRHRPPAALAAAPGLADGRTAAGDRRARRSRSGRPTAARSAFFADAKLKRIDMNAGLGAHAVRRAQRARRQLERAGHDPVHANRDRRDAAGLGQRRQPDGGHVHRRHALHQPSVAAVPARRQALPLPRRAAGGGPRSERGVHRLARRPHAAAGAAVAQPGDLRRRPPACSCATARLWAQPFDVEREALGGAPVAVARDVLEDPTIWRGIFSTSDTGTLDLPGRPGRHVA